jgi:hypothetical protein
MMWQLISYRHNFTLPKNKLSISLLIIIYAQNALIIQLPELIRYVLCTQHNNYNMYLFYIMLVISY